MLSLLEPLLRMLPLWAIALLIVAAALLARAAGAWIFRAVARRRTVGEELAVDEPYVIAAIFGLLAFILGLTFSIALDRYDARRVLATQEANAIDTTYMRAALFDEPYSSQLQATLRVYARSRISPPDPGKAQREAQARESVALRNRFRAETLAATRPVRETELASYFLDAANEMLNTGTLRTQEGIAHVPTRILDALLLYLLVSAAVLGYLERGRNRERPEISTVLLVLFTVVIILILDLDRPQAGAVRVPQVALEQLVARLDAEAAARQAMPPPAPEPEPAPAPAR